MYRNLTIRVLCFLLTCFCCFLSNRSTSGILITAFGITGDKPVPSAFLP